MKRPLDSATSSPCIHLLIHTWGFRGKNSLSPACLEGNSCECEAERDKTEFCLFTPHLAHYSPDTWADISFPSPAGLATGAHANRTIVLSWLSSSLRNVLRIHLQTQSAWRVAVLIYHRAAVVDFCLQDQRKAYSHKRALLRKLESACSGIKLSTSRPGLGRRAALSLQPELQAELCCPKDKSK